MKNEKNRYMEEQMAYAPKQAELGTAVPEICRKLGIVEQAFYRWRSKYAGMLPSDLQRLKKLVADLSLDKLMLQDVLTKKWLAC